MIRIQVDRARTNQHIVGFRVDGHAQFDDTGKDIVCAGVSAVTIGTVNAAESVVGVSLTADMDSGKLHVKVPAHVPEVKIAQLQLLLESMVVMLQSIEETYGQYIRLKQNQV